MVEHAGVDDGGLDRPVVPAGRDDDEPVVEWDEAGESSEVRHPPVLAHYLQNRRRSGPTLRTVRTSRASVSAPAWSRSPVASAATAVVTLSGPPAACSSSTSR